jgi:ABC-type polysaccharide/polyol phosphate transport system ATPase subunit
MRLPTFSEGNGMESDAIVAEHLSRKYAIYANPADRLKELVLRRPFHREFWALRDISLRVPRGQAVGVIGQNGSGKSTLLQILAGVLQPTMGAVDVHGRVAALLELGAGFNPEFTGRENVILNGAIMGISEEEMLRRFDEIAAFADIGDFIDQPVKTYSSGMYVRLAFATTINVDPEIIIVDEALAVGDAMFQRRCFRRLERLQRAGKTLIFVTHDTTLIKNICSTAYLLDHGELMAEGDPAYVVQQYQRMTAEHEEQYARWVRKQGHGMTELANEGDDLSADAHEDDRSDNGTDDSPELRYGDRATAEIVGFELLDASEKPCAAFETGALCTFRVTVAFHQPVAEPGLSLDIRTVDGVDVYGIDNWSANVTILPHEAGDILTVDFTQELWLGVGSYFVELGVQEVAATHIRALDRRVDVLFFKVNSRRHISGLANLHSAIAVHQRVAARS